LLNSILTTDITIQSFLLCTATSLILGLLTSLIYCHKNKCSQSFSITLAILPAIVQIVIMLVNGNIGAGVAVAGAFSLVRFRSVPGSAQEIGLLFLAMAMGLATGMGYIILAACFFVIITVFMFVLCKIHFGLDETNERFLKISVPEDLEYEELFDDLFEKYTDKYELISVKTSNMGTLFDLKYSVILKENVSTKEFIDNLRCRNGNLTISYGKAPIKDTL